MSSRSSTTEGRHRPLPDRVAVGRVRKPHGVAGAVLVAVESDVPGRFSVGQRLHLSPAAGGPSRPVVIAESQGHGDSRRLRFEGFSSRDACEDLRGALLEVDRTEVPPAPPGTFYHFELEGCRCTDRRQGLLGEVTGVLEDGGGCILTVRGPGGPEVLVPFVKAFLVRVDTEAGEIELDLPEGLVDACTSSS